ncbi:hypothetical protein, partial [Gemmatimonas sp.]|uniref:hypothetical protein n=1 Tax=Gemmatimonas sp. TaxID=1962908 RepID=UPI0025C60F6C
ARYPPRGIRRAVSAARYPPRGIRRAVSAARYPPRGIRRAVGMTRYGRLLRGRHSWRVPPVVSWRIALHGWHARLALAF